MLSLLAVAALALAPAGPTRQDARHLQELAAQMGLHYVVARDACTRLGETAAVDGPVRGTYSLAGSEASLSATLGLARVLGPADLFQVQRNRSPSATQLDLVLTRADVPDRAYRLVTTPDPDAPGSGVLGCVVLLNRPIQ